MTIERLDWERELNELTEENERLRDRVKVLETKLRMSPDTKTFDELERLRAALEPENVEAFIRRLPFESDDDRTLVAGNIRNFAQHLRRAPNSPVVRQANELEQLRADQEAMQRDLGAAHAQRMRAIEKNDAAWAQVERLRTALKEARAVAAGTKDTKDLTEAYAMFDHIESIARQVLEEGK
jgi:RNase H-fold protein (predicted Holliday junction resolvase)